VIAYLDASALVKLVVDEAGTDVARDVWQSDVRIATARISQVEVACALEAAVRDSRLRRETLPAGIPDGGFLWQRADAVEADSVVVDAAALIGVRHGLRGVDALHVASALGLESLGPVLVSWDLDQRRAAAAEGLPVYP